MRLRSFELVIGIEVDMWQGAHGEKHDVSISTFLNSFRGLEDRYLMVRDVMDSELLSRSGFKPLLYAGPADNPWKKT